MQKNITLRKIFNFSKKVISAKINTSKGLRQKKYLKSEEFDYDGYKKLQTEGNYEKITQIFENEENIKILSDYLKSNLNDIQFGLCHGTRRGEEQKWFRKYLKINVLGTEISDTATEFPNTIQWDFHKIKDEWVGSVDFIYSNALDHSYDAKFCLLQWFKCLKKSGICIINCTTTHSPYHVTELDPFGFTIEGLRKLINEIASTSNVKIEAILDGKIDPSKKKFNKFWKYFIIRKLDSM